MTPLHWAVEKGHLDIVDLLLSHGAISSNRNKVMFDFVIGTAVIRSCFFHCLCFCLIVGWIMSPLFIPWEPVIVMAEWCNWFTVDEMHHGKDTTRQEKRLYDYIKTVFATLCTNAKAKKLGYRSLLQSVATHLAGCGNGQPCPMMQLNLLLE